MAMNIEVLKSKIHMVTVTEANLHYIGSITIDEDLMDAANIIAGEKVQIVNINNGERLETYVITGERGSGSIIMNGPAARKVAVGDVIIIIAYASMDFKEARSFKPTIIFRTPPPINPSIKPSFEKKNFQSPAFFPFPVHCRNSAVLCLQGS
jgi:aspartate 1-decarboxylase